MLTMTSGGSTEIDANAVIVLPMSSRPSATVTTVTPVAKWASASVNSPALITGSPTCPASPAAPPPAGPDVPTVPPAAPTRSTATVPERSGPHWTPPESDARADPAGGSAAPERTEAAHPGPVRCGSRSPIRRPRPPGPARTRPDQSDPALGHLVDLVAGHLPALSDLAHEVVVDVV